jgi:5-methylcytosine-specific restriction endonuclease McrA
VSSKLTNRPVLFVLIGWARRYDGTEAVVGGHKYLPGHPKDNAEAHAFVRQDDGAYHCGAGRGELHEDSVDAVFIARRPTARIYEVVALYLGAKAHVAEDQWCTLAASDAVLFPVGRRPKCVDWPAGQGMRRWAQRQRSRGASHQALLDTYRAISRGSLSASNHAADGGDIELEGFEGELRRLFVLHRKREIKLRAAKIRQALQQGHGHLQCEAPRCGFDFLETYGEIGRNYAVVHHTKPLASLSSAGNKTSLKDLAIVCPNCHAMIHCDGQCRPISSLLKSK